jgi:D-beta-D-heptose 7-phosphate kinase/D-beta-D-heptose 1-phosphate adenosyltransferase
MTKLVFTNGIFDVIHAGHIKLLQEASQYGHLVVAINSDESVRRLKGEGRPINTLEDRMAVLNAIKYVDRVISFDEDTPFNLIKLYKPDILVKGAEWEEENIIGYHIA